ncbi:ATP-dependent sacrificial sulfur transferase LarE [Sesbania bispinosa]|nr:ATP-dependent sacrificial sulfur transferase LarE [Sesbania bispinosa]
MVAPPANKGTTSTIAYLVTLTTKDLAMVEAGEAARRDWFDAGGARTGKPRGDWFDAGGARRRYEKDSSVVLTPI